jgi:hypothetical protein
MEIKLNDSVILGQGYFKLRIYGDDFEEFSIDEEIHSIRLFAGYTVSNSPCGLLAVRSDLGHEVEYHYDKKSQKWSGKKSTLSDSNAIKSDLDFAEFTEPQGTGFREFPIDFGPFKGQKFPRGSFHIPCGELLHDASLVFGGHRIKAGESVDVISGSWRCVQRVLSNPNESLLIISDGTRRLAYRSEKLGKGRTNWYQLFLVPKSVLPTKIVKYRKSEKLFDYFCRVVFAALIRLAVYAIIWIVLGVIAYLVPSVSPDLAFTLFLLGAIFCLGCSLLLRLEKFNQIYTYETNRYEAKSLEVGPFVANKRGLFIKKNRRRVDLTRAVVTEVGNYKVIGLGDNQARIEMGHARATIAIKEHYAQLSRPEIVGVAEENRFAYRHDDPFCIFTPLWFQDNAFFEAIKTNCGRWATADYEERYPKHRKAEFTEAEVVFDSVGGLTCNGIKIPFHNWMKQASEIF